jgi:hypothetical protein
MMAETNEKHYEKDPRLVEAKEHMKAARQAMRQSFEALMPPGYVEKRRAAHREMLLAMRSLVDAAIAHVEKKAEE